MRLLWGSVKMESAQCLVREPSRGSLCEEGDSGTGGPIALVPLGPHRGPSRRSLGSLLFSRGFHLSI